MIEDVAILVKNLVNQIDSKVTGSYDSINMRFNTCDTKWAMIGKSVTDEFGNSMAITEIEQDAWVKLTDIPQGTFINLPTPFFINGTKIATNNEWTKTTTNIANKTPLVWLLEVFTEEVFSNESPLEIETEIRLFFLDETNILQNWTQDHRQTRVVPLVKLSEAFVEIIKKNKIYKRPSQYMRKTFSRFGTETENGMLKNILDANLSGVELQIELKKYKENCKNC